jgi:DNA-directed RNA polymerase beta' subunit
MLALTSNIGRCGQETEDGCGARQPDRYVRDGIARIVAEWDNIEGPGAPEKTDKVKKERQVLEVEYVLRLFRRITDEDVDFMGLSRFWCRPDWMICTVVAVPPPQVRPSVIQDNNQRSEDDLTHKLFDIVNTNNTLQDKINNNAAKNIVDEYTNVLQYHIATLVDNQIPGVAPSAQRSGRPLKSIQQRLGSKEGRIRYNIQGKRVEFSARSVITPDPNISVAEIGVPMKIAMNLTIPERVTSFNRDQMYKLIQNGADKYPGAKTLVRADGRMISLKHVNSKEIVLYFGDIVNRHLADGDVILFNRQPTLHRMSMMGHRVKVLPYNTFRLNVSVTSPYNADFDGDEMNAHIPQSLEASTELAEIAAVPHQIVTPRHAKPVIGVVQDSLVGSWRMTRPKVNFTRREFMNMMMWNKRFEGIVPVGDGPLGRFTGQQILSQLLPPINLEMGNGFMKDAKTADEKRDNYVVIKEGIIQQGIMDKDIFSKPSKGIVHTIFKDYGSTQTVNFIDAMQNTVEQFLVYNGFSVGISDLVADENTRKEMDKVIKARKTEIENILLQLHLDLFDNNTGKTNQQEFEDKVYTELNKATELSGKIGLSSLADENRLIAMVRAGSKGSTINIAQMMACVGQQAPEGRRIPYGFSDRTLPHYKKYDDGAEARGFVESSFIQGLTPQEFFFHAMSGREGLIDTAVKTADTGYIQRQLVKAMEDLVIQFDGSVRDARGNVLQFHYGEDGINSTKIETQGLGLSKMTDGDILTQYSATGLSWEGILTQPLAAEEAVALEEFSRQVLEDRKMLVEDVYRNKEDGYTFASVNLDRLILNASVKFHLDKDQPTDLSPGYVLDGIKKVIHRTQSYHKLWAAMLRFYLAPHKMIAKQRFTKVAFDTLLELIVLRNWQAWAQPGEQVGIIAAQSIGEPSTQMSAIYDTIVVISQPNGENYFGPIGAFMDALLEKNATSVVPLGDQSSILDLSGYKIASVSKDEKVSWAPISQFSRHPANGGLVKVVTKSGRSTTATLSHSFLKRSAKGIVPVLGSDLKLGMRIPIAKTIPEVPNIISKVRQGTTEFTLTKEFGWLCGIYLADGSLVGNTVKICKIHPIVETRLAAISAVYEWVFSTRHYEGEYGPSKDNNIYSKDLKDFLNTHFKTGSYAKELSGSIYSYPTEFKKGLLSGYFDGDGNVNVARQQIRVGSRSEKLIRDINRLFGYVGFFTVLGEEASIRIPGKVMWTLNVLKNDARKFKEQIGLSLGEKTAALDQIIEYVERDERDETKEMYDKIPELGELIAETGKLLKMPAQSRTYGRWLKKESVGRTTLQNYLSDFNEMFVLTKNTLSADTYDTVKANMAALYSAANSDVVWDEIVDLIYLEDPKTFVYDFTVPGTESFMVDDCIMVHNTLNTFHLAGVAAKSNVTRGVPRLKELLKVTKSPKAISLTVYLKPEFREDKEKARETCQDLELTLLRDVTTRAAIYYDPKDEDTIADESDKELIAFYKTFEKSTLEEGEGEEDVWSRWMLRLELDRERLFAKNISMEDIAFVLRQRFDDEVHLIYSDFNSPRLIMRIRLPAIAKSGLDDLANLKKFVNRLLNGIVIRGVTGIKSVKFREDKDLLEYKDGKYEKVTQYVLDTDGTNYQAVMSHPMVDGRKLVSSHVHDIFENLGIEATRAVLLNEIITLFEAAGADVNFRHPGLLCDVMTRAGKLMSADRYGINKNDIGPLAKASFEETEKILLRAAVFGEVDPVTGVSANIMTGQVIRGGTAFSQLLLDENALMRLQENLPPVEDMEEEEEGPTDEQVEDELFEDSNDLCSKTRLRMNIAMPTEAVLVNEPDVEMIVMEG